MEPTDPQDGGDEPEWPEGLPGETGADEAGALGSDASASSDDVGPADEDEQWGPAPMGIPLFGAGVSAPGDGVEVAPEEESEEAYGERLYDVSPPPSSEPIFGARDEEWDAPPPEQWPGESEEEGDHGVARREASEPLDLDEPIGVEEPTSIESAPPAAASTGEEADVIPVMGADRPPREGQGFNVSGAGIESEEEALAAALAAEDEEERTADAAPAADAFAPVEMARAPIAETPLRNEAPVGDEARFRDAAPIEVHEPADRERLSPPQEQLPIAGEDDPVEPELVTETDEGESTAPVAAAAPAAATAPPAAGGSAPDGPRREFLKKAAAVAIGGAAVAIPVGAGVAVFLDPLRRREEPKPGEGERLFFSIATLDRVPDDSKPHQFPVVADRNDAWNRYRNVRIGAVYLIRRGNNVTALNVVCPHAGCFVDADAGTTADGSAYAFSCPCHRSFFSKDGSLVAGVSPRGMDELDVDPQALSKGIVAVHFQNFKAGTAAREPIA